MNKLESDILLNKFSYFNNKLNNKQWVKDNNLYTHAQQRSGHLINESIQNKLL